jgi:hypothetical protein
MAVRQCLMVSGQLDDDEEAQNNSWTRQTQKHGEDGGGLGNRERLGTVTSGPPVALGLAANANACQQAQLRSCAGCRALTVTKKSVELCRVCEVLLRY